MSPAFNIIYTAIVTEDPDLLTILRDNWKCLLGPDEKKLIKVLRGGGGGGVSNVDPLEDQRIVVGAGANGIKTTGWQIFDGINAMQLVLDDTFVEQAGIFLQLDGADTTGFGSQKTGVNGWGVWSIASGLNSTAVYGGNDQIDGPPGAGIGVHGHTTASEEGIGMMAETTTPDSWAFVIKNDGGFRLNFKTLLTSDKQFTFLDVEGFPVMNANNIPANSASLGTAGEVSWDANFFYVCINTNSWRRADLSAF